MVLKYGSTHSDIAVSSLDFNTQAQYMSGNTHLALQSRKLKKVTAPLYQAWTSLRLASVPLDRRGLDSIYYRVPVIVGVVVASIAAVIVAVVVSVVVAATIVNMAVYVSGVGIIGIGPVVAVVRGKSIAVVVPVVCLLFHP